MHILFQGGSYLFRLPWLSADVTQSLKSTEGIFLLYNKVFPPCFLAAPSQGGYNSNISSLPAGVKATPFSSHVPQHPTAFFFHWSPPALIPFMLLVNFSIIPHLMGLCESRDFILLPIFTAARTKSGKHLTLKKWLTSPDQCFHFLSGYLWLGCPRSQLWNKDVIVYREDY